MTGPREARRDAPAWLDAWASSAPVGWATLDRDLRCLALNDTLAALAGDGALDYTGRPVEEVLSDLGRRVGAIAREVFASTSAVTGVELTAAAPATPAGLCRWVGSFFPVFDAAAHVEAVGVVLMPVDATPRVDETVHDRAERRLKALQDITSQLAAVASADAVADVVVRAVIDAVDAVGGGLFLLDTEHDALRAQGSAYPMPSNNANLDVPLGADMPVALCVRTGEAVWLSSAEELSTSFPTMLACRQTTWQAHVALPLVVQDRRFGALVFSWAQPREFDRATREFLRVIAGQCSQALQRAELFQIEREARAHTERSADYALRLERITGALAAAYDPDEVIERFLDRGLPELGATVGVIYALDERRRSLELLGARETHARSRREFVLDEPGPLTDAARSGELVLIELVHDPHEQLAHDPAPAPGVARSWASVPLVAYGHVLGVAGLLFDERRPFDTDERAFLGRVGERLGQAIERSRLYGHERESRERAEGAAQWLRSVQSMASALARSATRKDVARALREHLQTATGADFAFVAALGSDRQTVELLTRTGSFELDTSRPDEALTRAVTDTMSRGRIVEFASRAEVGPRLPALVDADVETLTLYPIRAGRSTVAVIGLGWTKTNAAGPEGRRLLAIAASLGGAAFERAAAYDLDHHIADTLQQHLLTEPVLSMPGVHWAARYAPGSEELTAGGDWYDVIGLDGGRVALVVGDIVGHGVLAAAAMGQLRSATRALARREEPVGLLEALDEYVRTTGQGHLSSVAYVLLDLNANEVEFAVAGHPPPLIRAPDGRIEFVEAARGQLLGLSRPGSRRSLRRTFVPGSSIVLYTDGLVERRGKIIDVGMERLRAIVAACAPDLHPEGLCDRLLAAADYEGGTTDDITLLAVSTAPASDRFSRAYPARFELLRVIRREVREWLDANSIDRTDRDDIVLAVGEAVSNAIEHGSESDPARLVDVLLHLEPGAIQIRVRDQGRWVAAAPGRLGGHGIDIMRALVTDVDIRTDDTGTEVILRRALQQPA